MERRGFLEKFAKSAAGLAFSIGDIVKDINEERREFKYHLPRIIRITDETVMRGGEVDSGVLKAMFTAGLRQFYPDTTEKDIIPSLFPGLIEGAMTGIFIYGDDVSAHTGIVAETLWECLQEINQREECLRDKSLLIWAADKDSLERSGIYSITGKHRIDSAEGFALDEEVDTAVDLGGLKLYPYPVLSRICQFQIGLIGAAGDTTGKNLCRDLYLNTFRTTSGEKWLEGTSEEEKWAIYERISYPQGMKFRMFCAEKLLADNAVYLCGDGVFLDKFLSAGYTTELHKSVELVEIINPSTPIVPGIEVVRKWDDMEISWNDDGYYDFYQIYGGNPVYPTQKLLLGMTKSNRYIDSGGADKNRQYVVTRRWGGSEKTLNAGA